MNRLCTIARSCSTSTFYISLYDIFVIAGEFHGGFLYHLFIIHISSLDENNNYSRFGFYGMKTSGQRIVSYLCSFVGWSYGIVVNPSVVQIHFLYFP